MRNIVKLGLIGAGVWGKNYIHTIEKIKNVQISCIASRNANVCKSYSNSYKIFQNWKELIHSGHFDGLIIATPTDTHTKILNYCISQNIPTLAFWQNNFDHLRENVKSDYQSLVDAGIIHLSPKSAADKVNEIWEDVDGWWSQNQLQDTVKNFCNIYAKKINNPSKKMASLLLEK